MEQPGYEQRGYLREDFRLFHLSASMTETVGWHYHAFHKLCVYLGGDAIRYGASTAAEDERDLSKVEMSLERFRVFTRGYVRACPNLTARELELLPLGAKTITLECGMRFLTDHIDGDLYFAVHREGQNLDRARAQFKLAADMEKKWDDMRRIVAEETKA